MTMKPRRLLLCLGLVLSMSFLLFGCGPNNQDANATGAPEDTIDEFIDESTDVAEGTEAPEFIDDPLDALLVTEDIAREYGGFYIYRNGNLYSLNNFMSLEKSEQYDIGWRWNETILAASYRPKNSESADVISMRDIPLPTIEEGDEIRGYQNAKLGIDVATFEGYSLNIFDGFDQAAFFHDLEEEPIIISHYDTIQIEDKDGNIIPTDDMHNLNGYETYKVSWYENQTEYQEYYDVACSKCYTSRDRNYSAKGDYDYTIEGELTQSGYAVFDLSEVEPGIYMIRNPKGAFFEIK